MVIKHYGKLIYVYITLYYWTLVHVVMFNEIACVQRSVSTNLMYIMFSFERLACLLEAVHRAHCLKPYNILDEPVPHKLFIVHATRRPPAARPLAINRFINGH